MSSNKNQQRGALLGCWVMVILGIISLPVYGIKFLLSSDSGEKILGVGMLVLSFVIWFGIAFM